MRVLKAAWFARAARKARISDEDLCEAVDAAAKGQADDLGGGVFKKRLDRNRHRSIILARGGQLWIYQYLFAKKDRANIDAGELEGFRKLAKAYAALTDAQLGALTANLDLMEICNDRATQVQK